jgi:hypothetical protein
MNEMFEVLFFESWWHLQVQRIRSTSPRNLVLKCALDKLAFEL